MQQYNSAFNKITFNLSLKTAEIAKPFHLKGKCPGGTLVRIIK